LDRDSPSFDSSSSRCWAWRLFSDSLSRAAWTLELRVRGLQLRLLQLELRLRLLETGGLLLELGVGGPQRRLLRLQFDGELQGPRERGGDGLP